MSAPDNNTIPYLDLGEAEDSDAIEFVQLSILDSLDNISVDDNEVYPQVETRDWVALTATTLSSFDRHNHDEGLDPTSARALLMWCMHHLEPLAITKPDYPLDYDCPICHKPFVLKHTEHTPMLIRGIEGCKGHVFCNKCIVNWITSGQDNANTCPICRSQLITLVNGNLLPPLGDSDSEYEPEVDAVAESGAQHQLELVNSLPEEEPEDEESRAARLQLIEFEWTALSPASEVPDAGYRKMAVGAALMVGIMVIMPDRSGSPPEGFRSWYAWLGFSMLRGALAMWAAGTIL